MGRLVPLRAKLVSSLCFQMGQLVPLRAADPAVAAAHAGGPGGGLYKFNSVDP